MVFLPSATKLGQSYVFTHVCDSVHRGVVSQHALQVVSQHALQQVSGRGGIHTCLAAGLQGGWVVSQHALQDSRPTPRGEVQGSDQPGGLQAHTQGVSPGPHPRGYPNMHRGRPPPMATAAGQYASYWNAFLLL